MADGIRGRHARHDGQLHRFDARRGGRRRGGVRRIGCADHPARNLGGRRLHSKGRGEGHDAGDAHGRHRRMSKTLTKQRPRPSPTPWVNWSAGGWIGRPRTALASSSRSVSSAGQHGSVTARRSPRCLSPPDTARTPTACRPRGETMTSPPPTLSPLPISTKNIPNIPHIPRANNRAMANWGKRGMWGMLSPPFPGTV